MTKVQPLSKKSLQTLLQLSRLTLSEEVASDRTVSLGDTLAYVDALQNVDISQLSSKKCDPMRLAQDVVIPSKTPASELLACSRHKVIGGQIAIGSVLQK